MLRLKLGRLKEVHHLAWAGSRRYRRWLPLVWIQILWLKYHHDRRPYEIRLMGLLEKDLGEMEVARKVGTPRLSRWLHKANPAEHQERINIKSRFYETCRAEGIPVPEVYAVGRASLEILVNLPDRFLVKPALGHSGQGIDAFTRSGTDFLSWNGRRFNPEELLAHVSGLDHGNLVFQEWLQVHPSLKPIAAKALVTIRTITYRENGSLRIIYAYLKQPDRDSITDNWGSGGTGRGMLELDVETGKPVAFWSQREDGWGITALTHMGHGTRIPVEDVSVPDWQAVKALILKLAEAFPQLQCPGWDIGLTDRGPVAIEGNTHWGYPFYPSGLRATLEVTGPLK
jgi:hypothetical protein